MKLDLTGRQIEITEGIHEFVERKIKKFDFLLLKELIISIRSF